MDGKHTLADYAVIVASDAGRGGTWAGATEAIKNAWLPVFVLEHPHMPEGNHLLLEKGALPLPHPFPEPPSKLPAWLQVQAAKNEPKPSQLNFF